MKRGEFAKIPIIGTLGWSKTLSSNPTLIMNLLPMMMPSSFLRVEV